MDAGGTWWHLDSRRIGAIENRSAITVSIQGGLCDIGFTPEGGSPQAMERVYRLLLQLTDAGQCSTRLLEGNDGGNEYKLD